MRCVKTDLVSIAWEEPVWFWLPDYSAPGEWCPGLWEHCVMSFSIDETGQIEHVLMGYARHYGDGLSWSSLPLTREESP